MRLWLIGILLTVCLLQFVYCSERITLKQRFRNAVSSSGPAKMKKGITRRILGGHLLTTKEQEFHKHQVRLICRAPGQPGTLSCGGSLIADKWVVTAAHCLKDVDYEVDKAALYFGVHDLRDRQNCQNQIVSKENFYIPTGWKPETIENLNDIALIKLNTPVQLNAKVGIIDFPSGTAKCNGNENTKVLVSGWGMTDDNALTENNILKVAEVKITDVKDCRKTWGAGFEPNTMLCTSASNYEGTCEGDSGGPMITATKQPILLGVTSFGMPTCKTNDPRIFTCIVGQKKWLEATTGLKLFK